jgi:coenzyme Q-binding protein COQ10
MASAETTEVFNCTKQEFFNVISDYEKYSDFLTEVKSCKVVDTKDNKKLVEFSVSVIKSFSYRLWMTEEAPNKISWVFDSGDIFKLSNGLWDLSDVDGDKVQAKYAVEAKFKGFVPSPIAKGLVSVNLPNMINSYHKRIKEVYGK